MVKRAFGGSGGGDDLVHRGAVIALLVEQLPGCGDDFASGVARVFFGHLAPPPVKRRRKKSAIPSVEKSITFIIEESHRY